MSDERAALASIWPVFGLTIRTPRLELKLPTDSEYLEVIRLAGEGVHAEDMMEFAFPWELDESPKRERTSLQHHWRMRSAWKPESWVLSMGVFLDGRPIGCQDVSAQNFAITRRVATGSWLARAHHGHGLGTEMRAAVVHLAFEGLGADRATTSYIRGNIPSQRVSAKVGYEPNGTKFLVQQGKRIDEDFLRLERERWETSPIREIPIEIDGLEPCLEMLGADGS